MKKLFPVIIALMSCLTADAQMVATMEIKDNDTIQGLCDRKKVYTLFPMFGDQKEAECSVSNGTIQERLNKEVPYLEENPKTDDKGMVSIIINCKGEVLRCETDNETKSPELDKQILAVFASLKTWKPGKLNGKKVDSVTLWSFEIKNGKIKVN